MLLVESLAERPSTNPPKAPDVHKHIPQSPKPWKNNPARISNLFQSLRPSIANPPGSSGASRQGTGTIISAMGGEQHPNSISHSGSDV